MPRPLFSVVIPCYDCAATLPAAIASVQAQGCGDLEILLCDDGSTDATLELARRLAGDDARIRVETAANRGASATRNRAVRAARGTLVAFLDADDRWHPGKLAAHAARHAAEPALDASYGQIEFVPERDAGARTRSRVPQGVLGLRDVLGENPVCTMSNLVVRGAAFDRIGPLREDMRHAEDQEWLARAIAGGAQIAGIDRLTTYYHTSDRGLSSQLDQMYSGWKSFAGRYADARDADRLEALYCRYLARRALRLAGPAHPALRYAWRGIRADPRAFVADPRRGLATAAAVLAAQVLPAGLRRSLFA